MQFLKDIAVTPFVLNSKNIVDSFLVICFVNSSKLWIVNLMEKKQALFYEETWLW